MASQRQVGSGSGGGGVGGRGSTVIVISAPALRASPSSSLPSSRGCVAVQWLSIKMPESMSARSWMRCCEDEGMQIQLPDFEDAQKCCLALGALCVVILGAVLRSPKARLPDFTVVQLAKTGIIASVLQDASSALLGRVWAAASSEARQGP